MAKRSTMRSGSTDGGSVAPITVEAPDIRIVEVPIVGITELIVNRFSEKARHQMEAKQAGGVRRKKPPREPEADYEGAFYRMEDGRYGFPATGFKAAIVTAARQVEGITMTALKVALYVEGEGSDQLVAIDGEPYMRTDPVRNATGVADIRYRPGFPKWKATLRVRYLADLIDARSVVNLVHRAGLGGIGDWRPSAPKSYTGTYGTFAVEEMEPRR